VKGGESAGLGYAEGRARRAGSELVFEYYLRDHLRRLGEGAPRLSTRVTFGDNDGNGTPEVLQEDHYYPFGLKTSDGALQAAASNVHLYNGKELQDELGLGWYDYGARMMNPTIGRWNGVDALAEDPNQIDKSPYAYTWNHPTNLTDPDGNCPFCPAIPLIVEGVKVTAALIAAYVIYDQKEEIAESTERIIDDVGDALKPAHDEGPDGDPKPVVPPDGGVAEDEEVEHVYRGGSASDKNFTPRPGKDDGYGPKSGLSTFDSHEGTTFGRGGKSQKLNARVLRDAGFTLTKTPDGHVGIRSPSQEALEE